MNALTKPLAGRCCRVGKGGVAAGAPPRVRAVPATPAGGRRARWCQAADGGGCGGDGCSGGERRCRRRGSRGHGGCGAAAANLAIEGDHIRLNPGAALLAGQGTRVEDRAEGFCEDWGGVLCGRRHPLGDVLGVKRRVRLLRANHQRRTAECPHCPGAGRLGEWRTEALVVLSTARGC